MPLFAVCKRFVKKSGEKGEWEEEDKNREREGEKKGEWEGRDENRERGRKGEKEERKVGE